MRKAGRKIGVSENELQHREEKGILRKVNYAADVKNIQSKMEQEGIASRKAVSKKRQTETIRCAWMYSEKIYMLEMHLVKPMEKEMYF